MRKLSSLALFKKFSPTKATAARGIPFRQKTNSETEKYLKNLRFLSQSAKTLLGSLTKEELFIFIAETIFQISHNCIVVINEYDQPTNQTVVKAICGSRKEINLVQKLLQQKILGLRFNFTNPVLGKMISGVLVEVHGGLFELVFKQIPKIICQKIEKALNIQKILVMPFTLEKNFLGTVVIFSKQIDPLEHQHLIEAFINQSAVVLKRIKMEEELKQKKDEFISIASHELKTPITSLKAYTQLLLSQSPADGSHKKAQDLISKMDGQLDRLVDLVNQLLDVSRINSGKLELQKEKINLNNLLEENISDALVLYPNYQIKLKTSPKVLVWADRFRIGQVVTNLLTNAIKYSPECKEIKVSISKVNNFLVVSVADKGLGIPANSLSKIFEPFYRVNQFKKDNIPGIGLGLHICSDIIKLHGGNIWVKSHEGKGSTFFFSLPIRQSN